VVNEYILHPRIRQWFIDGTSKTHDFTSLNEAVYTRLFLMPGDDPWLGLAPPDAFSALPADGKRGPVL
jgi:hypothetical protein